MRIQCFSFKKHKVLWALFPYYAEVPLYGKYGRDQPGINHRRLCPTTNANGMSRAGVTFVVLKCSLVAPQKAICSITKILKMLQNNIFFPRGTLFCRTMSNTCTVAWNTSPSIPQSSALYPLLQESERWGGGGGTGSWITCPVLSCQGVLLGPCYHHKSP